MSYKHLTIEERCCLREFYTKGHHYQKIAKLLGINVSTISRELNRNFTQKKVLNYNNPLDLFENSIKKCCS